MKKPQRHRARRKAFLSLLRAFQNFLSYLRPIAFYQDYYLRGFVSLWLNSYAFYMETSSIISSISSSVFAEKARSLKGFESGIPLMYHPNNFLKTRVPG